VNLYSVVNTPLRCSGMSHILAVLPAHPANGMPFPAKAGTHLPTTEGWTAELCVCLCVYVHVVARSNSCKNVVLRGCVTL